MGEHHRADGRKHHCHHHGEPHPEKNWGRDPAGHSAADLRQTSHHARHRLGLPHRVVPGDCSEGEQDANGGQRYAPSDIGRRRQVAPPENRAGRTLPVYAPQPSGRLEGTTRVLGSRSNIRIPSWPVRFNERPSWDFIAARLCSLGIPGRRPALSIFGNCWWYSRARIRLGSHGCAFWDAVNRNQDFVQVSRSSALIQMIARLDEVLTRS